MEGGRGVNGRRDSNLRSYPTKQDITNFINPLDVISNYLNDKLVERMQLRV